MNYKVAVLTRTQTVKAKEVYNNEVYFLQSQVIDSEDPLLNPKMLGPFLLFE